jgi:Flp pilus assembly protein TadG
MNPKCQRRISRRKNERGNVLVLAGLGMVALSLIAGLCIDFTHLYMAQIELQSAADAAAIAGASQLNTTSGGIKLAVAEATKVLNKYDINTNVTIPSSAITFATNLNGSYITQVNAESSPANIRFLKVTIPPKPVAMSFSAPVLGSSKDVATTATAGMSVALTMNKFYSASIFIESCAAPLVIGQTYTLAPKIWSSSAANSYRVLAGTGGDLILTGAIHAYGYANGTYTVAQLSEADQCRITRIGVNTRFADYSWHGSTNSTDEPPDKIITENISYATYRQRQGANQIDRTDGVNNRRIITLPIAEDENYNTWTRQVVADRLGAFFLKKKIGTDCNFQVEYIGSHLVVPVGEYTAGGIQLNELSIAVLYK